ncbi:MAG: NAD(P)-dependent oxidoreductase [Proteobacteria bacterium]|nr:NAD(P)-dependent oxidoreductase [Pseudomonadota bacterium]
MKILVTGSNGFLGSAVVKRLLEGGERGIRCLVRPGSNRRKLDVLDAEYPGGIEFLTGTLNKPADCEGAIDGVDLVYHLAAAMGGAPAEMFAGTAVATKNLLEAMAASDRTIKLVHCSSFAVYGVAQLGRRGMVDENTPIEPRPDKRDLYSHTKYVQEDLVWQYHRKSGIPMVILRPGVIYGPGGPPMSARVGLNLFGIFLHLGRKNALPLTYVDNCADALVCAAENCRFEGEVYNVVDDDLIGARAFLDRYRKSVKKIPYVSVPYLATHLMSLAVEKYHTYSNGQLPAIFTRYKSASIWKGNRFDNSRLKSIGWRPRVSTEEGLRRHFEHLKSEATQ